MSTGLCQESTATAGDHRLKTVTGARHASQLEPVVVSSSSTTTRTNSGEARCRQQILQVNNNLAHRYPTHVRDTLSWPTTSIHHLRIARFLDRQ